MTPKKIRSEDSDVNGPPRGSRDAAANRERILSVADDVFSAGGEAASTEEVARRAEVGIATVFRHFPTKAALLQAVLVRRLTALRERADAAAEANDPAGALHDFLAHAVADAPTKLTIAAAFRTAGGDPGERRDVTDALKEAMGRLLARAQEAGGVRADVDGEQFYALLIAASRAAALVADDAGLRHRIVEIVSRGLRSSPRTAARSWSASASYGRTTSPASEPPSRPDTSQ